MKRKLWSLVLTVIASGLVILTLSWLLLKLGIFTRQINVVPVAQAINSPGKGDTPIATTSQINTVQYWLVLSSSTHNSWSYPVFLTGKPRKILPDLTRCESTDIATALNPEDRDNTASYGLLQFKPETLWSEAIHYGLIPKNTPLSVFEVIGSPKKQSVEQRNKELIYAAQLQVDVAGHMIMDNTMDKAFWLQQFPQCYLKYHLRWGN